MIHFREVQRFRQLWLWLILLAPAVFLAWGVWQQLVRGQPFRANPMSDVMLIAVAAFMGLFLLWMYQVRLVTEVHDDEVHVQFVYMWRRRKIPLGEIHAVRAVTYSPIRDYGGWGIRRGARGWAYNVSGNRGVEIEMADRRHLMVGSQQPEELARAIETRRKLAR